MPTQTAFLKHISSINRSVCNQMSLWCDSLCFFFFTRTIYKSKPRTPSQSCKTEHSCANHLRRDWPFPGFTGGSKIFHGIINTKWCPTHTYKYTVLIWQVWTMTSTENNKPCTRTLHTVPPRPALHGEAWQTVHWEAMMILKLWRGEAVGLFRFSLFCLCLF